MKLSLEVCFVLLLLSQSVYSRLSVYGPDALANKFPGNQIEYTVGAFGQIPTGKKLIGTVVLAEPLNACDPIDVKKGQNLQDAPFILVSRGICTYVQQVRHVQAVGGKMAIIMDSQEESTFTMADDGNGFTIEIPAIIIKKADGDVIKQAILNSPTGQSEVKLLIQFEDYDKQTMHYSFFLDLHDLPSSYLFIKKFQERSINVGVNVNALTTSDFEPFYKTFIQNLDYDVVEGEKDSYPNCYNNGHYCGQIRTHVDEVIYQKCLYKQDHIKWWQFNSDMADAWIKDHSIDFDQSKAREAIFIQLAVNRNAIGQCYNQSFVKGTQEQFLLKNTLLENEKQNFHAYNVSFIPAVALNHRVFHRAQNFQQTAQDEDDYIDHIIFSICEILPNPTQNCQVFMNQRKKIENANYINEYPELDQDGMPTQSHSIWIIIGIVIFLLFIFLVFAYLFRRAIINQYNEQNQEIDKQVAEYVNLHKANKNVQAL